MADLLTAKLSCLSPSTRGCFCGVGVGKHVPHDARTPVARKPRLSVRDEVVKLPCYHISTKVL